MARRLLLCNFRFRLRQQHTKRQAALEGTHRHHLVRRFCPWTSVPPQPALAVCLGKGGAAASRTARHSVTPKHFFSSTVMRASGPNDPSCRSSCASWWKIAKPSPSLLASQNQSASMTSLRLRCPETDASSANAVIASKCSCRSLVELGGQA